MDELSFGQWLRRQRKSLGLSQKQLADKVFCATITLRKIEAEQRHPSLQTVERLAQVLNISSKEHDGFVRFARGYSQSAPIDELEIHPWISSVDPASSSLSLIPISPLDESLRLSPGAIYSLDTISGWFTTTKYLSSNNSVGALPENHGTAPNIRQGAYIVLVVPIKMMDQAMLSRLLSLQESLRIGESGLQPPMAPQEFNEILEAINFDHPQPVSP